MDILRGRYRESFVNPKAIEPNKPLAYRFTLPANNHVFLPGHRIMVQVQSSWFPLYDRNPQTFVPNIFLAKPADYQKATQRVYHPPARHRMWRCRWWRTSAGDVRASRQGLDQPSMSCISGSGQSHDVLALFGRTAARIEGDVTRQLRAAHGQARSRPV